jgi:hypothetical protein
MLECGALLPFLLVAYIGRKGTCYTLSIVAKLKLLLQNAGDRGIIFQIRNLNEI